MSSNVIHQAPSARRQASPSKRTTGNTSHSCFAVSLVAAAIALAACPAMAAGMVTAGSGAGVAVGATSSTTGANQVAVGPNAIICQNNFRHSFSLTWSGKTCDIRRSL